MAKLIGQSDWACDLVRAFGEDPHRTRNLTLKVPVDGVVTVEFERYVDDSETEIIKVIRKVAWIEDDPQYVGDAEISVDISQE